MMYGSGVCRGRRHLVRIVVVPGVIPQVRGYRVREGERWQPESRLDDEAADAGCAEMRRAWQHFLGRGQGWPRERARSVRREVTSHVCGDP